MAKEVICRVHKCFICELLFFVCELELLKWSRTYGSLVLCVIKSHKEFDKEALRKGNNTIRLSSTSIVAKNYSIVYQFPN